MTKKTNISLDNVLGKSIQTSVFDRIVKEIDADEIPAKYIDRIEIQYYDGSIIELPGVDITDPVPMSGNVSLGKLIETFKKIRDVRVFISTERLEVDINEMVEKYLGKYC